MDEHPRSEQELANLLRRAAPQQLPPADFDHASVLTASRRAGVRRRAITGGVVTVVVLLGGGAALAAFGSGPGSDATAGSSSAGQLAEDPAPTVGPLRLGPQLPGPGPCGPVDRTVYTALVRVFAELSGEQPFPLSRDCPAGTTGVSVRLTAGGVVGRLEVLVGPVAVVSAEGKTGTAATAGGRTVTVVSVPAAGAPVGPYAGTLDDVAQRVAVALG